MRVLARRVSGTQGYGLFAASTIDAGSTVFKVIPCMKAILAERAVIDDVAVLLLGVPDHLFRVA